MSIRDKMSSTLNRIANNTARVNRALETTDRLTENVDVGSGFDPTPIRAAEVAANQMNDTLARTERQSSSTDNQLKKLLKTLGLVALAHKAFTMLKEAIAYASDLGEVQNVIDVTFGNATDGVNAWAESALRAYGMNEVSAKRYVGTMGAMLKSSGLAGDSVIEMSQNMVGLAGDMASFYNLDLQTAFEKIRSGISGETEPLKQLGINMSVANLEAYALSQGIQKSYSSMSQAEQVALRYNYLMVATADAQGDFARTSGSWANQTRLLSESWKGFTGVLAENLLPVLTSVVIGLNTMITFLLDHGDTVSAVLLGFAVTVGILTAAWLIHTAVVWLSVAANRALVVALLSNPILWIAIAIGVLVAIIYKWIQSVGGVRVAWLICADKLQTSMDWVKISFMTGINFIMNKFNQLQLCFATVSTNIQNFMGDMKAGVLSILQNMVNGAIDIINGFINTLNKIPGVNIGLIEQVTFGTTAQLENEAAKSARASDLAAYQKKIESQIAKRDSALETMKADAKKATAERQQAIAEAKQASAEKGSGAGSGMDIGSVDSVGSVGSIDSDINIAEEDLKFLRDVAEMRYVQNFVTLTPTVAVDAKISEKVDVDEVVRKIETKLEDEFVSAAEGVYN